MVHALGLEDPLAGITHESDYPASVKSKPVVVSSAVEVGNMTEAEIDKVRRSSLAATRSRSNLVQDLCDVCAPSGNEVGRALKVLSNTEAFAWHGRGLPHQRPDALAKQDPSSNSL